MEEIPLNPPPNAKREIPIIHVTRQVYASIYKAGNRLAKHHKLGIHDHIEKATLELLSSVIQATFSAKNKKLVILEGIRVTTEILKHLIRTEHELKILPQQSYIEIIAFLIEISKMANGWIKYLLQHPTQ